MKLRDYIRAVDKTEAAFAELIGVRQSTVCRYLSGERFPRPFILERIRAVTGGKVTADDFLVIDKSSVPVRRKSKAVASV